MTGRQVGLRPVGRVIWVNGPVVRARATQPVGMLELVEVGPDHLVGEIIRLREDELTVQVYEETSGLRPGAVLYGTGMPLSVELGRGLLTSIFDGSQRPLPVMEDQSGAFIGRGIRLTPLYHQESWDFSPQVEVGTEVSPGTVLGVVPETPLVDHYVMVPHDVTGELTWIAPADAYTLVDVIARVKTARGEREIPMLQRWPVRQARPSRARLETSEMLVTGQRVLDTFFPLAKGGAAAIPGGFGAGKTILQHQVAKWSDADVIIYVGCGERGNEMTDVLREFPELRDPKTGRPLMERTLLIANTSNMPVAAREASIYTGVTLAEYYRDMGYNVAMMADSTSRWAEALREISGRLEEMPAEEGYPAYLAARLAAFYERAGRVETLCGRPGSVSLIGAVSPPGGDFSEPVTQHTQRFVRCFWALDKSLASERHYPSVNWLDSYSRYVDILDDWWAEQGFEAWSGLRSRAMHILLQEDQLRQIVQLIGADALPDDQRLTLQTARLLKEGFLQQNALDETDTYCSVEKQIKLLDLILTFHARASVLIEAGCPIVVIQDQPVIGRILRLKETVPNDELESIEAARAALKDQMDALAADYDVGDA